MPVCNGKEIQIHKGVLSPIHTIYGGGTGADGVAANIGARILERNIFVMAMTAAFAAE